MHDTTKNCASSVAKVLPAQTVWGLGERGPRSFTPHPRSLTGLVLTRSLPPASRRSN